jgi:hypothetical protein
LIALSHIISAQVYTFAKLQCLLVSFVIGHSHKYPQLNVMLAGKVLMVKMAKCRYYLSAPLFLSENRAEKLLTLLRTCVWQNIYATEETDIDKLDDMFLDKSETWNQFEKENKKFRVEL